MPELNKKIIIISLMASGLLTVWSLLTYYWSPLGQISLVLTGLVFTAICLKNFKLGLFLALGELFFGSVGRLLTWPAGSDDGLLSLRIILWTLILIIWLGYLLFNKNYRQTAGQKVLLIWSNYGRWLVAFGLVVMWGVVWAWWLNTPLSNIIADANGWLYFALLGPLATTLQRSDRQTVFNIFLGTAMASAILTIGLFILFSLSQNLAGFFYPWLRDLRSGEATFIDKSFWRIFMPSQFYVAVALLISWAGFTDYYRRGLLKKSYRWLAIFALTAGVVYLSLSRTFWLGLAVTLLIMAIYYLASKKITYWQLLKFALVAATIMAVEILLITSFVGLGGQKTLNARLTNLSEPAASSRLNQLSPLYEKISQRPIVGWGFGQTITYQSQDPLILNLYPDGQYTTFTSEWGYFDMILKFGLVGLIIYFWGLLIVGRSLWRGDDFDKILFMTLIFLITCHIFSPYLNHPLGLGYLAALFALTDWS